MASVIGFGLDLTINVAILTEDFAAQSFAPVVKIGAGSLALPGTVPSPSPIPNHEQPAGPAPVMDQYDLHGLNFATDTAFGQQIPNSNDILVNFQGGLANRNLGSAPDYSRHNVPRF
jgi:hypothetical protein